MTDQAKRTVRVACTIPGGLMIRLQRLSEDDGHGRVMVWDGTGLRLNGPAVGTSSGVGNTSPIGLEPGITEVNAEWWAAWADQHKKDPLLTDEHVRALPDEGADQEGEENPTRT